MKDFKYILKRIIIGVGIALVLMIIKSNVFAYTYFGYSISGGSPSYSRVYETRNSLVSGYDYWFIDLGQYQAIGNANGQYLTVSANYTTEFYFGSGSLPSPYQITSYLNSARNTLNSNNLRCGIGDYGQGYDATYAPTVPQFQVLVLEQTQLSLKLQITFVYSQQRQNGAYTNTNASCWFVRNPNNGLFAQQVNNGYSPLLWYRGTVDHFTVSLTKDQNTELLNTLVGQNQQIINQNQQQINGINNINSNLTDDTPPNDNELTSALDAGSLPGGGPISNIITFPLTMFNRFLSVLGTSCTDLTIPIPYVSQNATIQCVNVYFTQLGFGAFYEFIGGLIGGVVLFYYLMYLYDRVNHLLFLEEKGDLKRYYS